MQFYFNKFIILKVLNPAVGDHMHAPKVGRMPFIKERENGGLAIV